MSIKAMDDRWNTLAQELKGARTSGATMAALTAADIPADTPTAYTVQDQLISLRGETVRAWKIGASSAAAQGGMGLSEPFSGPMFDDVLFQSPAKFAADRFSVHLFEPEIAIILASDLRGGDDVTADEAAEAIGSSHAAIELIDFRSEGGRALGALGMITDHGANGGFVMGDPLPADPDAYWSVDLDVRINGASVATRTPPPPETHPAELLAWLARHLWARGRTLRAGDVITTGTQAGIIPYKAGDKVEVVFASTAIAAFECA